MGRWPPSPRLLWYLDTSNLDAVSAAAVEAPIAAGISSWNQVCGVTVLRTADRSQAQLVVRFLLDLADDPMADQSQRPFWLVGDELGLTDEPTPGAVVPLVMRLNPRAISGWTAILLRLVAVHESGHFLGFDHCPSGTPSCMEAIIDQRINTQTPYDQAVAQSVYGPPLAGAA